MATPLRHRQSGTYQRLLAWTTILAAVTTLALVALPSLGIYLVDEDDPSPSDAVLVLEGSGPESLDAVEAWRLSGLIHSVIVVEGPIRTHALVSYWSDFVSMGLAQASPTPREALSVVRAEGLAVASQATAAVPELQRLNIHSLIVPSRGLMSRVDRRELGKVLGPMGISTRLVPLFGPVQDPGGWFRSVRERRLVLTVWLQILFPWLSGTND